MKSAAIALAILLAAGAAAPGARTSQEPAPTPMPSPAPTPTPIPMPAPIDIPEVEDAAELMRLLDDAHRQSSNRNPVVARRGAAEAGRLSLAVAHPRFAKDTEQYREFAADLWRANRQVQEALANPGDRRALNNALQAQTASCAACHRQYRPKPEESR